MISKTILKLGHIISKSRSLTFVYCIVITTIMCSTLSILPEKVPKELFSTKNAKINDG